MSVSLPMEPALKDPVLKDLARTFLRLGATSFGGPAVHIAMMEDEFVSRRNWLNKEQFLDLVAATNLIPGPNSTEMAIHIGYRRAGFKGLVVAGAAFITPAILIVSIIAHLYLQFGNGFISVGLLYGIKPAVVAIIIQALLRLGRTAIKNFCLAAIGLLAAVASLLGGGELLILGSAAVAALINYTIRSKRLARRKNSILPGFAAVRFEPLGLKSCGLFAAAVVPFSQWNLFLIFFKAGAALFGSGYVLLAFIRADLVQHYCWISEAQLMDAIAVGQITPGPLFSTATFVGYILAGPAGAFTATIGVFMPAFLYVAVSAPLLPRLRESKQFGAALDALNAASLALMMVVTFHLALSAITDPITVCVLFAALFLLFRCRLNPSWIVLFGGLIGLTASAL